MKKVDHDSRRLEVAIAAAKLIASDGLAGLTTRALAARMGCSIGVLSHYFSSKSSIVQAAFDWADSRIDARMEEAFKQNPSIDSLIPVILAGLPLDESRDIEWRVRFNLQAYTLSNSDDIAGQQTKIQRLRVLFYERLNELQANGNIRQDIDLSVVTSAAFDLVIGTAHNLLMVPMEKREAYAQTLLTLVDALRPEAQTDHKM